MATDRSDELYRALKEKGYPERFLPGNCIPPDEYRLHGNENVGLVHCRISSPRPEDVVDEMLAILSDRNAIMQKKELEHAQATINEIYRKGL